MLTLILPRWLPARFAYLPATNTPALDNLVRFGRFHHEINGTIRLYSRFLCNRISLPENQVYASPFWQQAGMHSIYVGSVPDLSLAEAQEFSAGLNRLYGDDARFEPLRADLWKVTLPEKTTWQIDDWFAVCGKHLDGSLFITETQPRLWMQLSTEIPMWLNRCSPNQERTEAGKLPVSGLWLWNAPPVEDTFQAALIGSNSAWTQQSSLHTVPLPENFAAWRQQCLERHIDIHQTVLFAEDFARCTDPWHYADTLADWDTRFFAPLWQNIVSGSLKQLRIICEQGSLHLKSKAHRSFWKRRKTFSQLATDFLHPIDYQ